MKTGNKISRNTYYMWLLFRFNGAIINDNIHDNASVFCVLFSVFAPWPKLLLLLLINQNQESEWGEKQKRFVNVQFLPRI